ncbi:MAG TPA: type II secretion system protein GspG [Myxococcota bacterium]|nr:type II secretion system protein GspG [Myxococcota bacterium]
MEAAERRLQHVVWAGTAVLGACLVLRFFLPAKEFGGTSVSRENGVCVLRDAAGNLLLDPWKRPYLYLDPTPEHPRPRVVSLGADGKVGGEGDCADIDSDELWMQTR